MSLAHQTPVMCWPAQAGLLNHLFRLARHGELFLALLMRHIKVRYRQSVLGLYWAVLHPLAIALVLTLAFSFIVRVSIEGAPYFLFALSGLLAWNFFAHGVTDATESLVAHTNLVTKVPFPKEVLPLSAVSARGMDFFCSLGVVIAFSLVLGKGVHLSLIWIPVIFTLLLSFTAGLGLLFAMANLYYRDTRQVVAVVLPLWMYLTPVIYPAELVPEPFGFLLWLNPMAGVVTAFRDILLYGVSPDWLRLLPAALLSLALLILTYLLFKRKEPTFAEAV